MNSAGVGFGLSASRLIPPGHENKVLLIVRDVQVDSAEHLRLYDHDASTMIFKQPIVLRIAGEALNDEFDRAHVPSVRHAIASLNVLT